MVVKPDLHDLSVPGFRNIFLAGQPLYKRLILILVILLFCGLSVFQIVERIRYYMSEPTSISYRFEVESMIRFPSVSICPADGFRGPFVNNEKVKRNVSNVYDLLSVGLNLTDIWKLTGNNFTKEVVKCRYGGTMFCITPDSWKLEYSLLGLCYTLEFLSPIPYSGFISSYLGTFTFNWTYFTRVFIHDSTASVIYAVYERGVNMNPRTASIISFNHRKVSYVNMTSRPCYSQGTYRKCLLNCYDKDILEGRTCRLPFITPDRSNLTMCSTAEDFRAIYPIPFDDTATTLFHHAKECKKNCGRPCVKYQYDITVDSRNTEERDLTRLVVTPLREGTHIFEERIAYYMDGLLCDIGAIIGLYLGISLLTVVEFLEIIYFIFSSKKE